MQVVWIIFGFLNKSSRPFCLDEILEERIIYGNLLHEFSEIAHTKSTLNVIFQKIKRIFANRWKRKSVYYKEGLISRFLHGSIAHLRPFETIND